MKLIDGDYVRDEILYGEAYVSDELAVYIKRVFDNAPTIEAEPVKHGRYITDWLGDSSCSVCGENYLDATKNYCPNCGAKMDAEDEA